MAQESNLGIKITIKGADQAVSTIKELKTAIQLAQQELEGMKRGTAEYDRLTKQVANANAAIKDFNKSVEGVTIEQQAEQFGKFAGGVTASFAAASAAVNLFGGDADRVSKAAVEAQNLLTIAISARAIAEGFAATKTIVLNTLTKTGTILNQGFTKSFKALTAAIAANPFGALVVAIGAVITAITLLNTKQTESEKQAKKAAEAQLQYAEAVKTAGLAASVTANQVGFLINELNLGNISLEDAEPLIRKFASGIKGISLETEEGRKTFNEYITALANFSQTQDKISAKQTELSEALKEGNTERARAIRNEITELTKNLARYQTTITNIENQSQQNEDAAAAREEARKKREEERLRRIQEELALRKEQLIAEEELTRAELLRYSKGQAAGELDIEQNLKERLKLIQESINKVRQEENVVTKFYKAKKTFSDAEIATLKQLGIQVAKEVKNLDNAGKSVDKIMEDIGFKDVKIIDLNSMSESQRARMEAGFGPIRDFSKDFKQVLSDLIDPALIKQIEDEQIKLETNIKLVETAFVRAGQEIPENFAAVVQAIQNINAGQATRFEDIQKAQADFDAARKKYVDDYVKQNTTLATTDKLYGEQQAQLTKTGEAYFDQLVENQQNVNNYNTSLQNITKTVNDLIIAQNKYVESGGAITDFIAENRSEIVKQIDLDLVSFRDTLGTLKDIDKYFSQSGLEQYLSIKTGEFQNLGEQVKRFEEELRAQGIDITKAEYEEKLRLLREYLEKKNTEEKQGLADFNKNILDGIQQFQSAVTAISQVTADSFRFQIQMAEEDYQRAQENIVGDTEEANQKRLEADKIYNEKKKQLEKEAAKTSLQLSLAQAIANAAAALVKVTEQTGVFAVIAGTAIAAANFAAISQISLQLNRLDSFQKGGYIKAQGGMVVGPSHEYGGVKYAQGGVELEGGEAVINRVSSVRYQGLLSEINQAGGGKPLVMNNFDDSRIVEAIAKQRKEPLRAYVVERDITSAQQVTKRLESLSQI